MITNKQLRISAWAIQNPTPVAVLFIALVIAGLFTLVPGRIMHAVVFEN